MNISKFGGNMRSILTSLTFWVFVVWSCVVLGGGLYEAIAVWPLVASDPPPSLAATNQVLAVPDRAGNGPRCLLVSLQLT